jgi:uncharacterized protein YciI
MEENKQELLPCPFCAASDPLLFRRDKTGISNLLAFVQCFNIDCGGSMNGHFTDESAIKAWNTRTSDVQSLQKVNASLQKYIEAQEKHVSRIQQQNAEYAALLTIGGQMARIEKMDKNMDRLASNMELMRENEVAYKMTIGQQSDRIAELEEQLKNAKEHITRLNKIDSERGTY